MEACEIITEEVEVQDQLAILGLEREWIMETVLTMVTAKRNVTANHPPSAGGTYAWSEGIARLREILIPHGWQRYEEKGVQMVLKGNVKIGVCNMDGGTGMKDSIPRNRARKGEATVRFVEMNQGELFDFPSAYLNTSDQLTFLLCVYCDQETYRAELSCPISMKDGYVEAYSKRIILVGPGDVSSENLSNLVPNDSPDFDVPVVRKQS